jgi:hypothetical protein
VPYHLDFDSLGLDFLEKRLAGEDLIPSQMVLREGLADTLERCRGAGVASLADLERKLATAKLLQGFSASSGVPAGYLTILARTLRGYRPKPVKLPDYPSVDAKLVSLLAGRGIIDSRSLFDALHKRKERRIFARAAGADEDALLELVRLADLSRIQWVSPLFARLLLEAGFSNTGEISRAKADDVYLRVDEVNKDRKLFKGKIGTRDMGRLVFLAALLPHELED